MDFEALDLKFENHLAVLTLNRPEAHNAITAKMKEELALALDTIEGKEDCRVLIITGAGEKAFCAGADIKERSGTDPTATEFVASQRATIELFSRIANLRVPTIAALNGIAVGGGAEIALACDFRIAADTARFGLTEINLGVIPAGGGTQRLVRTIGLGPAKRLILTGEILPAAKAEALGLVDEIVPATELITHSQAFAEQLAGKAPMAVQIAKSVLNKSAEAPLAAGLEMELQGAAALFASDDRKEGMRAFLEKRPPRFTGR